MIWAVAVLILIASGLLIYSYVKNKQAIMAEQREIDTIYITLTEEINKLQTKIRQLELENEIISQASGMMKEDLHMVREALDMYRRGYTVEGIADKLNMEANRVEALLSPYMSTNGKEKSNK